MPFYNNLRNFRIKHSLTQTELAKKLNLSRTAVSNYENAKVQPSLETLISISELFHVTVDELLKK